MRFGYLFLMSGSVSGNENLKGSSGKRVGRLSRRNPERFSWDTIVEKYRELIDRVLRKTKRCRG